MLLQVPEISQRIIQPVRVVDPEPIELSLPDEPEDQPGGLLEYLLPLHRDRSEAVDVEKPAVVDLIGRHPPIRKAISLPVQEGVEEIEAARIPFDSIIEDDVLIDKGPDLFRRMVELGETLLNPFDLPPLLRNPLRIGFDLLREMKEREGDAVILLQPLRIVGHLRVERIEPMPENFGIGPRGDRKAALIIFDMKRPFRKGQIQLLIFQDTAVLVAQDRQEDLAVQLLLDRLPVDIEVVRIGRIPAVLQNIPPPLIP